MSEPELIKKITRLKEYLDVLEKYSTTDTKVFLEDEEKVYALERVFQLVVDEAIDINTYISYHIGGKVSESYKSTFFELVSLGIISNDLAEKISESAGLRNKLVHDYEKMQKVDAIQKIMEFYSMYVEYTKVLIHKYMVDSSPE